MKKHAQGCLTGLAIGLLLLTGCSPQNSQEDKLASTSAEPDVVEISAEAEQASQIQLTPVAQQIYQNNFTTMGQIRADENRIFHISPMEAGRVMQDRVMLGQAVQAGQVLALIQNPSLIKAQADSIHALHDNEISLKQAQTKLTLARQNLDREEKLYEQGISPRKDLLEASANLKLAQTELAGLQEHGTHIQSEARALLRAYNVRFNPNSEKLQTGSPLQSPRAGVVTRKNITVGDTVTPEQTLYEVADLSQVWLDLPIYANDVTRVKQGDTVVFQSDSLPGQTFQGQINYIQPDASPQSHTFLVRAFLNNPGVLLKPGMYGQASIRQTGQQTLPWVNSKAIQTYGKEYFVFVSLGKGRYQKRVIVRGPALDDGYLVEKGLQVGEQVVGQGSFTLKAELLKHEFAEDDE